MSRSGRSRTRRGADFESASTPFLNHPPGNFPLGVEDAEDLNGVLAQSINQHIRRNRPNTDVRAKLWPCGPNGWVLFDQVEARLDAPGIAPCHRPARVVLQIANDLTKIGARLRRDSDAFSHRSFAMVSRISARNSPSVEASPLAIDSRAS